MLIDLNLGILRQFSILAAKVSEPPQEREPSQKVDKILLFLPIGAVPTLVRGLANAELEP